MSRCHEDGTRIIFQRCPMTWQVVMEIKLNIALKHEEELL